jgi:hypothetical protein
MIDIFSILPIRNAYMVHIMLLVQCRYRKTTIIRRRTKKKRNKLGDLIPPSTFSDTNIQNSTGIQL